MSRSGKDRDTGCRGATKVVVLRAFLIVLAASMAAAAEVLLTQANPGVRLPLLWEKPPVHPVEVRILTSAESGSAFLGVTNSSVTTPGGGWGTHAQRASAGRPSPTAAQPAHSGS